MTTAATSTLSRFPAAAANFVRDLYVEHLEEAAFLYDQRNYMLENIEMEPHDIAWNEQRCDRHLDALVAGGELTLTMCMERAAAGEEASELYAAMRVFCRANRPDLVNNVLDELDTEDTELTAAARDGLKHELPKSWSVQVSQWLDEADEALAAILAVASAYRELSVGPAVVLSASVPLTNPVPFLWALGRLREPTAALLFTKHLQDGDDEVKQAAAIGALRCGDPRVAGVLRSAVARGEAWAAVPLALIGNLSDFAALESMANSGGPDADVALALGLLGHVGATNILLGLLDTEDTAEGAARALHMLSGLGPLQTITANADSLLGDDARRGDEDQDEGPPPIGLTVSRAIWEPMCRELRPAIEGEPIRFGEADSPASTLRAVASYQLPASVRTLLTDALLLRHDVYVSPGDGWRISASLPTSKLSPLGIGEQQ